ncbi:MAG: hypothetical protein ACREM8_04880 [Vulcanimicrobiaceae bacterium]
MKNRNESTGEVPIACSLTAVEARERVERWTRLAHDAKTASATRGDSVEATFRNDSTVRHELVELVAAERQCCAFLTFDLRETDAGLVLTISAPRAEAKADLELLASSLGIA